MRKKHNYETTRKRRYRARIKSENLFFINIIKGIKQFLKSPF